jgi:hypothetical protein
VVDMNVRKRRLGPRWRYRMGGSGCGGCAAMSRFAQSKATRQYAHCTTFDAACKRAVSCTLQLGHVIKCHSRQTPAARAKRAGSLRLPADRCAGSSSSSSLASDAASSCCCSAIHSSNRSRNASFFPSGGSPRCFKCSCSSGTCK